MQTPFSRTSSGYFPWPSWSASSPRTYRSCQAVRHGLASAQLCVGLVYHHHLQPRGTLAEHLEALIGEHLSDSAASQRRLKMPWEVFETILEVALAPLAEPAAQPTAFYAGLRLVGVDGTQFSLQNTPAILGAMPKAASRRLGSAFAKRLGVAVLVELGTHAPLAAAIAAPGEVPSEAELAAQVLCRLPEQSLLSGRPSLRQRGVHRPPARRLARRAGAGFPAAGQPSGQTKNPPSARRRQSLGGGASGARGGRSTRASQRGGARGARTRAAARRGLERGAALDEPARWSKPIRPLPCSSLYARRWEQELACHELKMNLRGSGDVPLAGHTPETAAQEVAALLVGLAMIARARLQAAAGSEAASPPLRVSFARTLAALQPLWLVLDAGADLLSAEQQRLLTQRVLGPLSRRLLPARRRARSCPRTVRQPVSSWPRLIKAHQQKGNWPYEVTNTKD